MVFIQLFLLLSTVGLLVYLGGKLGWAKKYWKVNLPVLLLLGLVAGLFITLSGGENEHKKEKISIFSDSAPPPSVEGRRSTPPAGKVAGVINIPATHTKEKPFFLESGGAETYSLEGGHFFHYTSVSDVTVRYNGKVEDVRGPETGTPDKPWVSAKETQEKVGGAIRTIQFLVPPGGKPTLVRCWYGPREGWTD